MKTNTQKGSVIMAVIAIVVLLIIGGIYYFSQTNNIKLLTKDVRVAAEYKILNDESLWRAKNIISNLPMQWDVTEKDIVLKGIEQNKFMCGDKEAQFVKYSSFNNGSVGGWNNISVVDCLDYYFVYEFGDAGPKMYGPFSKDQATPDTVSNLKTYRNEKYGFEFKYQNSWNLLKEMQASSGDYMPLWKNGSYSLPRSFVAIYPTQNRQDFSARIDVYNTPLSIVKRDNPFLKNMISASTIINGVSWTKMGGGTDYLIESNGQTYHVSGRIDLVDQILSAFKFIN